MPLRLLPDLLTHGDETLRLPRRKGYAHAIGKADLSASQGPGHHDPSQAGAVAVHEWLAHVAAGRIGDTG